MKSKLKTQKDLLFAKQLKFFRVKNDYKQSLMAELIGIKSQQEYSRLEKGYVHFSELILSRICEALGLELEDFVNLKYHDAFLKQNSNQAASLKIFNNDLTMPNNPETSDILKLLVVKRNLQEQLNSINQAIETLIDRNPSCMKH